jgi:hypothetical protein
MVGNSQGANGGPCPGKAKGRGSSGFGFGGGEVRSAMSPRCPATAYRVGWTDLNCADTREGKHASSSYGTRCFKTAPREPQFAAQMTYDPPGSAVLQGRPAGPLPVGGCRSLAFSPTYGRLPVPEESRNRPLVSIIEASQNISMRQSEIEQFTSWLGKRSDKARVERFGLERIQEIARENGKRAAEGQRQEAVEERRPTDGGLQTGEEQILVVQIHLER